MKLRSALVVGLLAAALPARVATGAVPGTTPATMDPAGALDGRAFVYGGTPAFRIELPDGARVVERTDPGTQVVRLETAEGAVIEVSVVPVEPEFVLAAAGSRYVGGLRKTQGPDHKLLSSQWFELADGTAAHDARIESRIGDATIETVLVSAHVAERWVFVSVHDEGVDGAWIAHSLRFDPTPAE